MSPQLLPLQRNASLYAFLYIDLDPLQRITEPEMCYQAAFVSLMHPCATSSGCKSVYRTVAGDL